MSKPLTEERLAEIEAARYEVETDTFGGYRGMALSDIGYWRSEDDSDELIAEVRRLRALLDELDADFKRIAKEVVEYERVQNARIMILTEERGEALARVKELEGRA